MSFCFEVNLLRPASTLPLDFAQLPAGHPFFEGPWLVVVAGGNRFGNTIKARVPAAVPDPERANGPFTTFDEEIRIEADSTCDLFVYRHWRGKELVRDLRYCNDGESNLWETAAGTPEPWEGTFLFSPGALTRALSYQRDDPDAQDATRKVWEQRSIEAGQTSPLCDASMALALLDHLGFTFHR